MPKRYQITAEQKAALEVARKENKDKNIENRLKALTLRAESKKNAEIAQICEYHPPYVSQLVSIYCNQGLKITTSATGVI